MTIFQGGIINSNARGLGHYRWRSGISCQVGGWFVDGSLAKNHAVFSDQHRQGSPQVVARS